jgi:DNA-binding CsgD family transcriptional regulator
MLTKIDLENILEFVYDVQGSNDNFREQVISSMTKCFGFNKLTFFLGNDESLLLNPIGSKNIEVSMTDYTNYYYQTDMFLTSYLAGHMTNKIIVTDMDLMAKQDYHSSEYYCDFLQKNHLNHQAVIPFVDNNNSLGVMGILRGDGEPAFSETELELLHKISRYIVNMLRNTLANRKAVAQSNIFSKAIELPHQGIILFDNGYNIYHENTCAAELSEQIQNMVGASRKTRMIKSIPEFALESCAQNGSNNFDFGNYSFHLVPHLIKNEYGTVHNIYSLYITQKPINLLLAHSHSNPTMTTLTQRERDIVRMIKKGYTNKQISSDMYISPYTVKTHLQNIYKKMYVNNRTALIDKIYG